MRLRHRIALAAMALTLVAGCSSHSDTQSAWVEDEVTFVADGLTIHGTYRHQHGAGAGPSALLISESGRTDRNGDNNVAGPIGNMRQLADYLSDHGVASLRYDKVGTGQTGLGPYAGRPADVGSAIYTGGAKAAVRFLAGQSGTDKNRISVYGLGEGTIHAMSLADDTAAMDVQRAGLDQVAVDRGVEEAVIDDVVDVAIDVVVHPACRDAAEVAVAVAALRFGARAGG